MKDDFEIIRFYTEEKIRIPTKYTKKLNIKAGDKLLIKQIGGSLVIKKASVLNVLLEEMSQEELRAQEEFEAAGKKLLHGLKAIVK